MYLIKQQGGFLTYYVYAYDDRSVRFIHRRDLAKKWPRRQDAEVALSQIAANARTVTLEIDYLPRARP